MADRSAAAKKGWETRRRKVKKFGGNPMHTRKVRKRTKAPPALKLVAPSNAAPKPGKQVERVASKGYQAFKAEIDRLIALGHAGSANAPGAAAVLMGQHRAYTARYRREHGGR